MAIIGTGAIKLVQVDLVVDTAAYADGDLLSNPVAITEVFGAMQQSAIVQSLQILDDATGTGVAMDILFLQDGDSLGTVNNAFAASDALVGALVGVVEIAATDWVALGSGSCYAIPQFNPFVVAIAPSVGRTLYLAAIARGAYDAAAADDLHVRLGLLL